MGFIRRCRRPLLLNATFPTAGAPAQAVVQIADPDGNVATEMLDQHGQEIRPRMRSVL